MIVPDRPLDRRTFLRTAAAAAVLGGATSVHAAAPRPAGARAEPWGRLEPVGDRVWAMVSTPLVDHPAARRTLCNGGIVAGREGVLVVEAFASPEGAAWLSDEALRLTGMRPTHVVLTHYHGDHVSGAAGYLLAGSRPEIMATRTTRRLIAEQEAGLPGDRPRARPLLLPDRLLAGDEPTELDLGDRSVRIVPRRGHTPSDLVIAVDGISFPGDLVWNGMFPNYMDAIPGELSAHVRALRNEPVARWVSGHGEVAGGADLDRYIDLLDHVEAAARRALETGRPLAEAAADYTVPASLGEWHMFSPRYPEVAFRAWQRELASA
jgi:glyoxylase-like metal-dependent hydrolase (beta-lactamase superfamily II)